MTFHFPDLVFPTFALILLTKFKLFIMKQLLFFFALSAILTILSCGGNDSSNDLPTTAYLDVLDNGVGIRLNVFYS